MRSPTALSDTVVRGTPSLVITKIFDFRTTSLRGRTGRLRRTVRNPLRFDRFLHQCSAAYRFNITVGNSRQAFGRRTVTTSDGAYPRPEGRGIAPVHRIISRSSGAVPWDSSAFTRRWMSTATERADCSFIPGTRSVIYDYPVGIYRRFTLLITATGTVEQSVRSSLFAPPKSGKCPSSTTASISAFRNGSRLSSRLREGEPDDPTDEWVIFYTNIQSKSSRSDFTEQISSDLRDTHPSSGSRT